jgi:hypothetical protein
VRADGQRLADLAACQHLHFAAAAMHQPVLAQQLRRDHRARLELEGEEVEVDHSVLDAERVVESALRDAAVQRHLAAFESALELEARSRFRALVTAARRLAVARALAASDALLRVFHATRRFEIV